MFDISYEPQSWDRKFWAIPEFYDPATDDFLLGVLLYYANSTYNANPDNQDGKLYLPIAIYTKLKKQIANWEHCSIRTIERHMNYLLLQTSLVEKQDTYYKFRNDYMGDKQFYITIPHKILWLLLKHYHEAPQLIKIYVYLINNGMWLYRQKKEGYSFTISQIMAAMGYKDSHHQERRNRIKKALKVLCELGLINLHREYTIVSTKERAIPVYRIDFITSVASQLRPSPLEFIEELFPE